MEVEFGWGGVQTHFHVKPNSVRLKRNGKQVLVLLKLQVGARLTENTADHQVLAPLNVGVINDTVIAAKNIDFRDISSKECNQILTGEQLMKQFNCHRGQTFKFC